MVINIVVQVDILNNQMVKIESVRLGRLVPFERDKSNSTRHILSVIKYTRPTKDVQEILEDPTLK